MNRRSRRILGLTVLQLAILACLALLTLGVVGGGFWYVSTTAGLFPTPTVLPSATLTPTLTLTPSLTPFPTATVTPLHTPTPRVLIPEGWSQYNTGEVEMWLPPEFQWVDDPPALYREVSAIFKKIGRDDLAAPLEKNPPEYKMLFQGYTQARALFIPIISMDASTMTAPTLDRWVEQTFATLPEGFFVAQRAPFELEDYSARRVVVEANLNSLYLGYAHYFVYDGANVWHVICSAHIREFYTLLPLFDQIVQTFRLPAH
jgi:hypothetical protein